MSLWAYGFDSHPGYFIDFRGNMEALLKKKIEEVKKKIRRTKDFYRYSNKTLGYQPLMADAFSKIMIKHKSALSTLESLLEIVQENTT